jgi:hypothetical protein
MSLGPDVPSANNAFAAEKTPLVGIQASVSEAVDIIKGKLDLLLDVDALQAKAIAGDQLRIEHDALIVQLHSQQRHPDYQYDTTETGRKTGETKIPEGFGWAPNLAMGGGRGWARFDHTEEEYWLRLKTDADRDEVNIYRLPWIIMERVKRDEFLEMLRQQLNSEYMTSSKKDGFNSKPEYLQMKNIHDLPNDTSCYAYDSMDYQPTPTDNGLPVEFYEHKGMFAGVALGDIEILTNLKNDVTYIRAKNKAGYWGLWREWADYIELPLDRFKLKEQIDTYL